MTQFLRSIPVLLSLLAVLGAVSPHGALGAAKGQVAVKAESKSEVKPKYGPEATPLSVSSDYFRHHDAPVFWSIIPYYQAQETETSCSVAAVAMMMNGVRAGQNLSAEDELITQTGLLKRVKDKTWVWATSALGRGRSLDQLGPLVQASLKAYGFQGATVEVVHMENDSSGNGAGRKKLHEALVNLEKSRNHWILANFLQGVYTGDAAVGHFAPVAAFDSEKNRALVLDPDRRWYEPYWVSEETLARGMATPDKGSNQNRGFIWVRLSDAK